MISAGILLLGLVLLIGGGAFLVRGASGVASTLGISPLVVGLTVLGFGTSAPELVVNAIGALAGQTGLAFGNVVGSNITNLALVLGAAALIAPIAIEGQLVRREIPLLLLVTTVVAIMALDAFFDGTAPLLYRSESVVLLSLFLLFLYVSVLDLQTENRRDALGGDVETSPLLVTEGAGGRHWGMVVAGLALLLVGGYLTVRGAVDIAFAVGVPPAIIGLTVVAIGTSMPELVTSVIAAARGESDLAIGNVVGSNLFNSLVVLPVSGSITQIPVPRGGVSDVAVSWILAAFLIPLFFIGEARLGRKTGVLLLLLYFVYISYRVATAAP